MTAPRSSGNKWGRMAQNDNTNPATQANQTIRTSTGNDRVTGGLGNDTMTGQGGNDFIRGDGGVPGRWHFETFTYNFSAANGQAFLIESGTRTASGYVSDFNESGLTNTVRGAPATTNAKDFGVIYTSTLSTVQGGTYRLATTSDDGSTIQIFDSSGNALNFANQTGGTSNCLNNDFHQASTTRFGDVALNPNQTYKIQIRSWESAGQDNLSATIRGPDTGGATQDLLTLPMIGLPPGPSYSMTGMPAGVEDNDTITDFGAGNAGSITDRDQSNNDFTDLTAFYTNLPELRNDLSDDGILNQSVGDFLDNTALGGSITITGVQRSGLATDTTGVVCFVRGTLIHTLRGRIPIEDVRPDDRVQTRDDGVQAVRWTGSRRVAAKGQLAPVRIRSGVMGNDRDLLVSPQHRMLLRGWRPELFTGEPEALAAATMLIDGRGILQQEGGVVEYFHILFDRHQIILAENCWSESFQPGEVAINALEDSARTELLELFPELRETGLQGYGANARCSLSAHEAALCRTAA